MRVVFVSTHTDQTTGYSKVALNLLKQMSSLSPKVKVFHFGFQRHPSKANVRKTPELVVQYDAAANEDPKEDGFGFNKIHEYLDMVSPDLVMIYNDPLIIAKFIESMKHEKGKTPYKLWLYVDQVYDGIAPQVIQILNDHADRVYCFTEIWKEKYLKYGPFPDVRVLEHAVDPGMFTNMTKDSRLAIRSSMTVPKDAIVFLNANRNSQRKRLDLSIMGFVRLLARYPERPYHLMIVTNLSPQAGAYYDIQRIYMSEMAEAGLPQEFLQRLLVIDTSAPNVVGDDTINNIYNIADVGLNTSDGEGYGLCQLEHLYTGAPQIVTDVGSFRTFLNQDVAEFIPQDYRVYSAGAMPLGAWAPSFSPVSVMTAMESAATTLEAKKKCVNDYQFKSWATICDTWLEDILTLSTQ